MAVELGVPVNVYGIGHIDPNAPKRHKTTWIEYEIPEELEKELTELIDGKLEKFYNKCKCYYCKQDRENKKQNV